jgi:hypothetical protein
MAFVSEKVRQRRRKGKDEPKRGRKNDIDAPGTTLSGGWDHI